MVSIMHSCSSPTGYELIDDDKDVLPITALADGGRTLKLPKNSSNRSFISIAKVEAALEAKGHCFLEKTFATKATGTRSGKATKVDWSQYLDEADKKLYDELFAKATRKMRRAQIEAELQQLQSELNDMGE